MLFRVSFKLFQFMPIFFLCLFGFAFIFESLFAEQVPFDDFGPAVVKLLAMTIGELNFDDLFFNDLPQSPFYVSSL